MSEFVPDAELRDWSIEPASAGRTVVRGAVFGDRKGRFTDGERVRTSYVEKLENGRLTTLNSKYLLVNT